MEKKVIPMSLATKAGRAHMCQEYDWNKQSVKYDVCKANTAFSTGSGAPGCPEDWHAD